MPTANDKRRQYYKNLAAIHRVHEASVLLDIIPDNPGLRKRIYMDPVRFRERLSIYGL